MMPGSLYMVGTDGELQRMAASHRAASTDARRRRAFKRSLPVTEAQLWFWRVLLCGLAMVWMLAMGAMS